MPALPRLLITLGDVAGVGPEIVARAWPELLSLCAPIVVGDVEWMKRGLAQALQVAEVVPISSPMDASPTAGAIPVLQATDQNLTNVRPGEIGPEAGRAAYDFLCTAIDLALAGQADGIVTCPLHKEGLHAGGVNYPGHTEILADLTKSPSHGMMLWARNGRIPHGLGVVHVTLHMALHDVFEHVTTGAVIEKARLLDQMLRRLIGRAPKLAIAALNPHASDGGLFGHEERDIIEPAVREAKANGLHAVGPVSSDTLFSRAKRGEFDGVVAMYHDQGHIPMKLLAGLDAVNITVGLPIVRTSVAHGTAYDIAGKGIADHRSLIEATRVAALLAANR
ncbi:MAG: 4-hydroxythreonine-4-phosphate dehydrogenase PdxA [Gemmataceae bacterium]|nr:4-hydroxythreonine-4-phosphate dehydrogenase PdxA [Gemmataceae bacterium]